MNNSGRLPRFGLLLILLALPPEAALGQEESNSSLVPSVLLIAGSATPDAFLFPECSDGTTLGVSARLSRRLWRAFSLAVEAPLLLDPRAGSCTYDYAGPPEPFNSIDEDSKGQPNFAPSIRLTLGSSAKDGLPGWSVEGGSGYMTDAQTPFWLLGFSLKIGQESRRQLVLGWEVWSMGVRVKTTFRQIEGGEILLEETRSRDEAERMQFIRIGLRIPAG